MISALAIQDTSQPNSASGYMYPFGINSKMATVRKPPQPAFEFMNQPCGADQNQTIDHFFPEFLVESGLENSPEPLAYAARLPASSGHSRSERIPISSVVTKLKRLAQRAE
ncbi:MAG: hypothetical protein ABIZ80_03360, partial [Bryobacteraceae bacterium]